MGHMSGAYAARVSRDLALASRFDFNVYSYESEWTMGAEWWIRQKPSKSDDDDTPTPPTPLDSYQDVLGVVKARASTQNVRTDNIDLVPVVDAIFTGRVVNVGGAIKEHVGQPGCRL